ncbi:hypothetical protein GCM10010978_15830 [Compostibacillus humi]|uniref:Uncharacterized protein n=1 Tax=Compostibacillus humi TaxID=1245525 RepID=A0A8J2ZSI5_9BACI|nr:hypothetical protein GCM10010978_15830 [Compostibacillus humi]
MKSISAVCMFAFPWYNGINGIFQSEREDASLHGERRKVIWPLLIYMSKAATV